MRESTKRLLEGSAVGVVGGIGVMALLCRLGWLKCQSCVPSLTLDALAGTIEHFGTGFYGPDIIIGGSGGTPGGTFAVQFAPATSPSGPTTGAWGDPVLLSRGFNETLPGGVGTFDTKGNYATTVGQMCCCQQSSSTDCSWYPPPFFAVRIVDNTERSNLRYSNTAFVTVNSCTDSEGNGCDYCCV